MNIDRGMIIGRADGMDRAVASLLMKCESVSCYHQFSSVRDEGLEPPQLILILQHWPDEFSEAEVQALFAMFPLTRIICCYGPWCQSDGRNRKYWPASVRVPLSEVTFRIDAEVEVILGLRSPLEKTAGLDEVFEFEDFRKNDDALD